MNRKLCLIFYFFTFFLFFALCANSQNVYKKLSVVKCDSLIQANNNNPNFIILDVRTPSSWSSKHLEGSINRNYYDNDFQAQLDALPKHKTYLIHCQSGGRSGNTFIKMQNLEFTEVYDMIGGMNSWQKSYPTTNVLAPRLMQVSNNDTPADTIVHGLADTINITLTNRANAILSFNSFQLPAGGEFTSDFDINTTIAGAEDYSFSIYYAPNNVLSDSAKVTLGSNGGDLELSILLKSGSTNTNIHKVIELAVYPNPAKHSFYMSSNFTVPIETVELTNMNGQLVLQQNNYNSSDGINISGLKNGLYSLRIKTQNQIFSNKIIVQH